MPSRAGGFTKFIPADGAAFAVDAVFDTPWILAPILVAEHIAPPDAARLLIAAYPALPFVAVAATLNGGGLYTLSSTGAVLRSVLAPTAAQFAGVAIALVDNGKAQPGPGRTLHALLRQAGIDAVAAANYVYLVFPTLTLAEIMTW